MIAATPYFSDRGCHIRIYDELKYLKKNKIDVTLVTYNLGEKININGVKIIKSTKIPWYKNTAPGFSFYKIFADFFLLYTTYKEYLRLKPEILHAHLYEGLAIACIVKLLSLGRVKIIFDCQGSLAKEMYSYNLSKSKLLKPFYYLFLLIEKSLLLFPDRVICSSMNSYNFLINKFNLKKNKIDILDDGIDINLFNEFNEEDRNNIKRKLNISTENKIFIYTGSISKAKGVDKLLDEIPYILEKQSNIKFLIAGYGDLEDYYKEKYIDNKNIIFTDKFSYFDLVRYLSVADFAIEPKQGSSESSGKLLNYMGANLPIICFKNKFNHSVLKEKGIYINSFREIADFSLEKIEKPVYENIINWDDLVKKLINNYKLLYEDRN